MIPHHQSLLFYHHFPFIYYYFHFFSFSTCVCRETSSVYASRITFPGYGLFQQLADEECSSVASSHLSQASSTEMRWVPGLHTFSLDDMINYAVFLCDIMGSTVLVDVIWHHLIWQLITLHTHTIKMFPTPHYYTYVLTMSLSLPLSIYLSL